MQIIEEFIDSLKVPRNHAVEAIRRRGGALGDGVRYSAVLGVVASQGDVRGN